MYVLPCRVSEMNKLIQKFQKLFRLRQTVDIQNF